MAELTEGTYLVINCHGLIPEGSFGTGTALTMDVKGGLDKSGTNVQVYHVTNSDSQLWRITKPEGTNWQVICSLTGKSLDIESGNLVAGANVRQWNDNNSNAQRWVIEDDSSRGFNYIYGGKVYTPYVIRCAPSQTLVVSTPATALDGTNVRLASYSSGSGGMEGPQEWIFVPAPVLTEQGAYEIVLAADTSMCLEVASGSTANGANIQVYSRNDSDAQKYSTQIVNNEQGIFKFTNAKSSKVIEVKGGTAKNGANVQQYASNSGQGQLWLPVQSGTVKIDGQTVPTYIIRTQLGTNFCMDCQGGGNTAKTNIQLHTANGSLAQKFAFVKTERLGSNIDMPGQIVHDIFTRTGYGDVTVNGLQFQSEKTHFQARYMVRRYKNKRVSYSDSSWMNWADDSTSRSGWGDAWTSTFDATPDGGLVTIPLTKTVNTSSTYPTADIFLEVRAFEPNYGSGFTAHGPSMRSTIRVAAVPVITLSSMELSADSNGKIGIKTVLSDSFGNGTQQLRARLLKDGNPLSSWVSTVSMTSWFLADETLYEIPDSGDAVVLEYSLVTDDGVGIMLTGKLEGSITYDSEGSGVFADVSEPDDQFCVNIVGYGNDQSDSDLVSANCYMVIKDIVNTKMIPCELISVEDNVYTWRAAPPLNQNGKFFITGKRSSSENLKTSVANYLVEAHEFLWNWEEFGTNSPLNACAAVFIYPDAPPQQTRTYQTDIQFAQPSGRRYPVAFASKSLTATMSVEAIIVDEDARYVAAGPLPSYTFMDDVKKLILLSGQGIHPVYRTPYGDWHWVGIEIVDTSKVNLEYSKVSVTQRAMED